MVVVVGVGGWGIRTAITLGAKKYALIDSDDRILSLMKDLEVDMRLVVTSSCSPNDSWTEMYLNDSLAEKSVDLIARLIKSEKSPQELLVFHSLGGATGSAMTARICEDIKNVFTACRITTVALLPLRELVSVHVNPYVIAGLAALLNVVDGIILVEHCTNSYQIIYDKISEINAFLFPRDATIACLVVNPLTSTDLRSADFAYIVSSSSQNFSLEKSSAAKIKNVIDKNVKFLGLVSSKPILNNILKKWICQVPDSCSIESAALESALETLRNY
jgi:hypothetical protein